MKKALLNFADVLLSREQMKVVRGGDGEGNEFSGNGHKLDCYYTYYPPGPSNGEPRKLGTIDVGTCSPGQGQPSLLQTCKNTYTGTEYTICI